MAVSGYLSAELAATCNALGYFNGTKYNLEPHCKGTFLFSAVIIVFYLGMNIQFLCLTFLILLQRPFVTWFGTCDEMREDRTKSEDIWAMQNSFKPIFYRWSRATTAISNCSISHWGDHFISSRSFFNRFCTGRLMVNKNGWKRRKAPFQFPNHSFMLQNIGLSFFSYWPRSQTFTVLLAIFFFQLKSSVDKFEKKFSRKPVFRRCQQIIGVILS